MSSNEKNYAKSNYYSRNWEAIFLFIYIFKKKNLNGGNQDLSHLVFKYIFTSLIVLQYVTSLELLRIIAVILAKRFIEM